MGNKEVQTAPIKREIELTASSPSLSEHRRLQV